MKIKKGGSDVLKIRGKSVNGITLSSRVVHATQNTAFAALPVDYSKITLKVTAVIAGKEYNMMTGNALALLLENAWRNGSFQQINPLGTPVLPVLVAAAASTDEVLSLTAKIWFGGTLILKGDDHIDVEVTVGDSYFDGATVDDTLSELQVEEMESIGNMWGVPQMMVKPIEASASEDQHQFSGNISAITFINTDKVGITSANQVLVSANIASDKLSIDDNYAELLSKRDVSFETYAKSSEKGQSFQLFESETPITRAKVSVQLNAANVTASKNFLVVRGLITDPAITKMAEERNSKHARENAALFS